MGLLEMELMTGQRWKDETGGDGRELEKTARGERKRLDERERVDERTIVRPRSARTLLTGRIEVG